MGSSLSKPKPLVSLENADILDVVAGIAPALNVYSERIYNNGVTGEHLDDIEDEKEFETGVLDPLDIENKFHRRILLKAWKKEKSRMEKKRKLLEGSDQELVDLTNTALFRCLSEVPPPPPEPEKKEFMAPDNWLEQTKQLLLENMKREDRSARAIPMAFVRCSRGGKTRAIMEVIHLVRQIKSKEESCAALYVSFNNDSPIEIQEYYKSSLQELCDRIGFAAQTETLKDLDWLSFRDKYCVKPQSVIDWLGQQKCILFIDELNMLPSVPMEVANFLKRHFLLKGGRCYCFSSHLATTSAAFDSFLPNESNREIVLRTLPLIPSLEAARSSIDEATIGGREALYYGLIPGLLVARYKGESPHLRREKAVRHFIRRMNLSSRRAASTRLRMLLSSFTTGSVGSVPDQLQELMTADVGKTNEVVLRWIPFHLTLVLKEVREKCDFPQNVKDCLRGIVDGLDQYLGAKTASGDAWEGMFLVVLVVRCLSLEFEGARAILPIQDDLGDKVLVNYNKPWSGANFSNEQDPITFVAGIPDRNPAVEEGVSSISIYYPNHACFNDYDIIVAVWTGHGRQLHGYQLKEGADTTKAFANEDLFDVSYLIRGEAKRNPSSVRLFNSVCESDLEDFFGVSGSQWTPKRWKAMEAADGVGL